MARRIPAPAWTSALLLLAATVGWPKVATAQRAGFHLTRTPDGLALELPRSAGWRRKAAAVAQRRRELLAARRYDVLNAPGFQPSPVVVSGNLRFPTMLVGYRDRTGLPAALYDSLLYHESAGPAPYSLRRFYQELSNGLLHISGRALGWYAADSAASHYLNACGSEMNAVFCYTGRSRMRDAFIGALRQADDTVDFGAYDNDGPDGLPNSTDDDGFVDLVQFVHPDVGGECGGPGFWAHQSALSILGGWFITNDLQPDGSPVVIDGYTVVAGVGGVSCGNSYELMAIGGAAHELGHVLDLPDLYDTNPDDGDNSAGVGEWCLMGSGNYTSLASPAHLSAWPKVELGWVTVRELSGEQTYVLPPVISSDTVALIRPGVDNPRGESFLLENKQPEGADEANLQYGGSKGPKVGGLLIWHVDSARIAEGLSTNAVNTGIVHGVRLVQADNRWDLTWSPFERGDAGDPYPGRDGNRKFGYLTLPTARLNVGGLRGDATTGPYAGFRIDSIYQVVPEGGMVFRLTMGNLSLVRASDTNATVRVNGVRYGVHRDLHGTNEVVSIAIDSAQANEGTQYVFERWSDGGAREHVIAGSPSGDTIVATIALKHLVSLHVWPGTTHCPGGEVGFVGGLRGLSVNDYFWPGTGIEVVAVPEPGAILDRWTEAGVTVSTRDTLAWTVDRAYALYARFSGTLAIVTDSLRTGTWRTPYADSLQATGGVGNYSWLAGMLPGGLALASTGVLSGVPERGWTGTIGVGVASGGCSTSRALPLRIIAPVLTEQDIAEQVLGVDRLTSEQIEYLDYLGNQNGRGDVGDLFRWLITPPGQRSNAPRRPR